MKHIINLFLILFPFCCFGQMNSNQFGNRIEELIQKNNNSSITKKEKNELQNFGYSIQNRGMISIENFNDYQHALAPIDSAISFWVITKDTANEANMRKYKGMILGHLNRFEEGEFEIHKAISLFKSLKRTYGTYGAAVSKYDLANLLDLKGSSDSAIIYQLEASDFWLNKKDTSRIIGNNSQLIHLYCRTKDYIKAKEIQQKTELMLKPDLHWRNRIDFYWVSYELYEAIKEKNKADSYKKLYFDKLQEIKEKEGLKIKSDFDRG